LKGYCTGEPGLHLQSSEPGEQRRLTIVGGGTAGHVYPALTIADTYRRTFDSVDVLFIGTPEGCEARLVPAHGYRFTMVQGSPWFGAGVGGRLHATRTLVVGIAQARHLLRAQGAKLVIGLGGYASAGVLLAARSLGLRTVIHEANIVPGLANKLLGRLADRVYLGFKAATWAFPPDRTLVTGNPVRPEIAAVGDEKRRATCSVRQPVRILVMGGSQGAPFLNRHVPDLLRQVAGHGLALAVRHQVGDDDPQPVRAQYAHAQIAAAVMPYIEDMAERTLTVGLTSPLCVPDRAPLPNWQRVDSRLCSCPCPLLPVTTRP
jgi:UDP-N-acetylglucosamine--N-acetylmuramyl-(pentapeptide) pyrophosphoryl-undecaprenol N-acetylglucosamine transferase